MSYIKNQPKTYDAEAASETTKCTPINATEPEDGMDENTKISYRRAIAAGLISKDANPLEVMQRVLQYKNMNQKSEKTKNIEDK